MLTGELPGKRLEPPSRKVQIDVRLDEVVLRALEKNPELRYQQASEVKTMVETIAGTPAGAPQWVVHNKWCSTGMEYRSKTTLFGLPLLHVAMGMDPQLAGRWLRRGSLPSAAERKASLPSAAWPWVGLPLAEWNRCFCLWRLRPRPRRLWRISRCPDGGARRRGRRAIAWAAGRWVIWPTAAGPSESMYYSVTQDPFASPFFLPGQRSLWPAWRGLMPSSYSWCLALVWACRCGCAGACRN